MKFEKQEVKIYKLKSNKSNPRIVKNEKFKQLVNSIETIPAFMQLRPVIIDEDFILIAGNMRMKAHKHLGKKVIWTDMFTKEMSEQMNILAEEEGRPTKTYVEYRSEIIIKDNTNAGEWEYDMLANEWDSVLLNEWDKKEAGLIEDDLIPEAKESKVKLGDLWTLGNHKLFCGDSTKSEDVKKLMNKSKADLVFTDPPFDLTDQNYCESIDENTKDAHVFVMNDDKGTVEYLRKSQLEFLRFFIADFTFSSPRGNDPYLSHIIVSQEKKGKAIKHQNMHDGFSSIIKMKYRGTITNEEIFHKHQKPVDFVEKFINHFSIENDLVLDLFLGSGSTLIACEKLKRKCYGVELNEKSCDKIIERWEQFTGQKAIKNGTE
jgi:16S rRNA G966 N2-methylase RsmD